MAGNCNCSGSTSWGHCSQSPFKAQEHAGDPGRWAESGTRTDRRMAIHEGWFRTTPRRDRPY